MKKELSRINRVEEKTLPLYEIRHMLGPAQVSFALTRCQISIFLKIYKIPFLSILYINKYLVPSWLQSPAKYSTSICKIRSNTIDKTIVNRVTLGFLLSNQQVHKRQNRKIQFFEDDDLNLDLEFSQVVKLSLLAL